ncbi:hypothetical protein A4W93_01060 [Piscinibacter gummiphilus]|uniref:diguanylate cyclase n=2 Tax=Piscinibacter gummiphilus TaxID=946333 RepID=A0A1W6L375_9BURK|nr:hypothetical protein A4W93_01060 [Piscinibacter gummiphilus]
MVERLRAARDAGTAGVLAMCDLDMFKQHCDHHGHSGGDAMLKAASERLQALLPPPAWLARYGGDEFVAFLPEATLPDARRMLERCLEAIRQPIELPSGSLHHVTMSAGLVTFPAGSIDEVLQGADVALYAAKARGRDRVVVFDDDTRKIVAARRELAAAVFELQERNRALHDEARTDALTGLRNRLALDEVLDATLGGADPRFASAAVAFVDIDHFGNYNHIHSDTLGDAVLRSVAICMRAGSRDPDLVFRKGGEELVVVIPDAVGRAAVVAAERLRAGVEALGIPHSDSSAASVVTVTVGVASGEDGCSLRQLLEAASDQAMRAKVAHARNRVHAVDVKAPRAPGPAGHTSDQRSNS